MQKCVCLMKDMMEETIRTSSFSGKMYVDGQAAKEALIRSQVLINHLHECLKEQLLRLRVSPLRICPPVGHQKPEMKIVGFFKQKDQDVCVVPQNLQPQPGAVDWGPCNMSTASWTDMEKTIRRRRWSSMSGAN